MDRETIKNNLNNIQDGVLFENLGVLSKAASLTETITNKFIDMILSDQLGPGYTFPNELDLCEKLGVGRSTLREVYASLSAMGFVTRSKAGTSVNAKSTVLSSMPLSYMFKNAQLADIMEYRAMLEGEICSLAAKKINPDTIKILDDLIVQMKDNNSDLTTLTKLDVQFHFNIALACKNPLLTNTLSAVTSEIQRSNFSGYYADPQTTILHSISFHEKILSALRIGDSAAAREYMLEHINDIYHSIMRSNLDI